MIVNTSEPIMSSEMERYRCDDLSGKSTLRKRFFINRSCGNNSALYLSVIRKVLSVDDLMNLVNPCLKKVRLDIF